MTAATPECALTMATSEPAFCWDWVTWLLLAVLAVFVGAAFSPAVRASFVDLDDQEYVFGNPHVLQGLSARSVKWALTTRTVGLYIPATWVSLQTDATISRALNGAAEGDDGAVRLGEALPDATVYHVTNIVLHAAASGVLFLFLFRATKQRWASFAVALVWAVHPLRVESVAWVTERKDEIAGLFGFLAMYWYVVSREKGTRAKRWFWAACGALVVSMWGKPMFTVMPVLLLILDYWPLGRVRSARELRAAVIEKWPMWVVVVLGAIGAMVSSRPNGTLPIQAWEKGANAMLSYVRYIAMQVDFLKLAPFYPYQGSPALRVVGAVMLVAGLTAAVIQLRRRYPWLFAGWMFYLVGALPTIGFVQAFTQAYADRYTYLGSVGLITMVVFSLFQWRRGTTALVVGVVGVVVVLGAFTYRQTGYWRTSVTLFERARAVTPMSKELHWSLAYAYAREKRFDEAKRECAAIASADPKYVGVYLLTASIYQRQDQLELALAEAKKGLDLEPENGLCQKNYGVLLVLLGRYEEAVSPLEKAAAKLPGNAEVNEALQRVREMLPPGAH